VGECLPDLHKVLGSVPSTEANTYPHHTSCALVNVERRESQPLVPLLHKDSSSRGHWVRPRAVCMTHGELSSKD
jgi:hypothetical protein